MMIYHHAWCSDSLPSEGGSLSTGEQAADPVWTLVQPLVQQRRPRLVFWYRSLEDSHAQSSERSQGLGQQLLRQRRPQRAGLWMAPLF